MYNEQNVIAQSKSRHNKEVCTKSSIVLLLTLIGHDMVSFTISLGIHYKNTFHYLLSFVSTGLFTNESDLDLLFESLLFSVAF